MTHLGADLGFLAPAALCWLGSLYCLGWLRVRTWNPALAAIALSFTVRGVGFLIGAPTAYRALDNIAGVPNASRLIINICGLVWSASILVALTYWNQSQTAAHKLARRWVCMAFLLILFTAILWFRAEMPQTATNFSARNGHDLSVAAYMLVYHGFMSVGLIAVAVCCWRYAQLSEITCLRIGMWLTTVGAAIYLTFCVHRMFGIGGQVAGWSVKEWQTAVPAATGTGALVMMIGLTMPIWGRNIAERRSRRLANRRYRQMTPLWEDLCAVTPAIAFPIAHTSSLGIEFRLYRRMIEIYDGLLSLSAHLPTDSPDEDYRHPDPRRAAQRIHAAIVGTATDTDKTPLSCQSLLAEPTRDTEADWLATVSKSYARLSPKRARRCHSHANRAERGRVALGRR